MLNYAVHSYRSQLPPGGKLTLPSECLIMEMDLASLALSAPSSSKAVSTGTKQIFSESIPEVNGAVVIYDAKIEQSLTSVPELIRALFPPFCAIQPDDIERLSAAGIPTIMFACKSDSSSARMVDAAYANSLGEPFNVGLIEVTDETSNGRSKMRNGLRYLLWKVETRLRTSRLLPHPKRLSADQTVRQRRKASNPMMTASSSHTITSPSTDSSHQPKLIWQSRGVQDGLPNSSSTSLASAAASDSERASVSSRHSDSGSLHWIMQGPLYSQVNLIHRQGSMAEEMEANASLEDTHSLESAERESTDWSHVRKAEGCGLLSSMQTEYADSRDAPIYLSLQEIFDRLFANIVSMEGTSMPLPFCFQSRSWPDTGFVKSFFMTYRRFCRPIDVMGQFLDRLKEVEIYETTRDVKHWALQKWVDDR